MQTVQPSGSPPWSDTTKRMIALVSLAVIGIMLWVLADALPIVIVALVIAYLISPVTNFLDRRVLARVPGHRAWAILLTFVLLFAVLAVIALIVIPAIARQVNNYIGDLPEQFDELVTDAEIWLNAPITFNNQPLIIEGEPVVPADALDQYLNLDSVSEQLATFDVLGTARGFLASLSGPAFSFLGGAFNTIINLIFLLTMIFYLLQDGARFADAIVRFVPDGYHDDARRLLHDLGCVWNGYLRGQLILSGFVGLLVFLAATFLGLPNAPVLALISAVLEFVPNLGPLFAMIPAALLALISQSSTLPFLSGFSFALVVIVVWLTIQNVQAILVTPRVMGSSLNLHPFIVIVGVIAGASLAGALGVILAAPTIASLRLFGHYIYAKLTGRPPFIEPRNEVRPSGVRVNTVSRGGRREPTPPVKGVQDAER